MTFTTIRRRWAPVAPLTRWLLTVLAIAAFVALISADEPGVEEFATDRESTHHRLVQ